jgi:hypothetical protein
MKEYFLSKVKIDEDIHEPIPSGDILLPEPSNGNFDMIIPINGFLIFKRGTTTPEGLEPTDMVKTVISNVKFKGIYLGGDVLNIDNYDIIKKISLDQ